MCIVIKLVRWWKKMLHYIYPTVYITTTTFPCKEKLQLRKHFNLSSCLYVILKFSTHVLLPKFLSELHFFSPFKFSTHMLLP